MTTEVSTERVEALLEAVLDLDPEERRAVLARHRSAEPAVCAHVEGLLARAAPGFLDCLAAVPPLEAWFLAEQPAVAPGACLADYAVEEEIGRGGMAVVYRARQVSLNRVVALKMILTGRRAAAADVARFRAEAEAVARLQHPNIVQIYAIGEHDGQPLPPRQAARLLAALADAVGHAHERGILYLDLKPANILLQKSENQNPKSEIRGAKSGRDGGAHISDFGFQISDLTPKVADFGLARRWRDGVPAPTPSGAAWGTPSYMAPEQADAGRRRAVGPGSDVYALGAILYELLTGRPPFRAATPWETLEQVRGQEPVPPRRLQPKVARDLETVCLKCLDKEPARRYESAAALADDLRRWLRGEPVRARRVGPWGRARRWCRRQPAVAGLAALALLTLVGGFSTSLALWRRAVHQETRALAGEARALAHLHDEQAARAEAEDNLTLTLQMMIDAIRVSDTSLLQAPDVNPVAAELLLKAEACGARLLRKRESDHEIRTSLADARIRLGKFHRAHGQQAEALAWFRKAAGLFEPVSADGARHLGYLAYATAAPAHLGRWYASEGNREAADCAFAASLRAWQRLADAPPTPAWRDAAVAEGLGLAQALHDAGYPAEDILGRFARLRGGPALLGGTAHYDQFVALLRVKLACLRTEKKGPPAATLAEARESAAVLGRSLQDATLDATGRRWAALAIIEVSVRVRQNGSAAEALHLLEPATRTLQDLALAAPQDPKLLVKLADAWEQVAKARWDLDQVDDMLAAYRHALAAQRRAYDLAPAVAEYRLGLGRLLLKLGRKYCELGRLDDAVASLRERQALWPGDAAKHEEVLVELRKWAAEAGSESSPAKRLERQRYQDLIARLGKP